MLRAVVGLFLVVALCGILSQRFSADPTYPSGCCPSPATSCRVSTPRAVVVEHDLDIEQCDQAAARFAFEVPAKPAVRHLVTGRRDRHTTHLELLLTCGRLLI